jgi:hypothetical protein
LQGIRELELSLGCDGDYGSLGFMLGMLRSVLRRVSLSSEDADCEVLSATASFLYQLTGLTSLVSLVGWVLAPAPNDGCCSLVCGLGGGACAASPPRF